MKKEPAKLRSWHRPSNDECAQNQNVDLDCSCKKNRKPYRVVRVHAKDVNHGVNPDISIEIFPDGVLKLREARRSKASAKVTTIGELYAQLTRRDALTALKKRNAERAQRRKVRREERSERRQLQRNCLADFRQERLAK